MRYTYCADKERSHHYEKKKNPDIEHYIWQSQICVKKNNVCVYMEEHRYEHRYSLMCAETLSEKRHMKLSPDSREGTAGWRWQGNKHFFRILFYTVGNTYHDYVLLLQLKK